MKCKTTAIKLLKLKLTDVFSRTHNTEYQKNYLYQRVKSYPYGILLLPTTSNTPLDIQDFLSVMDTNLYSRMKEIFTNGCVGADSYVDVNAKNRIQGYHVCCPYFKLEWQSSKCEANKGKNCVGLALVPESKWE